MPVTRRLITLSLVLLIGGAARAEEPAAIADKKDRPAKVLLIGSPPDSHAPGTHEYLPAMRILAACLAMHDGIDARIVRAEEGWEQGPKLLADADAAVIFLTEGAKWIGSDLRRLEAMNRLAARGGGLVAIHWGMGTRDAKYIDAYVKLLGGCHGGPDRRFQILTTELRPAEPRHPAARGVRAIKLREEFYYRLKLAKDGGLAPVMTAAIDGNDETVAWAWQRPAGGRSFGFSGLHFHDNWRQQEYRRLVTQGVLWALGRDIPAKGVDVAIDAKLLRLPAKKAKPAS